MGERLAHRGAGAAEWTLSPSVHFGQRSACELTASPKRPCMVLDGDIDNLDELVKLLGRTCSTAEYDPAEVTFSVFRRFGVKGFRFLKGHFAVALWDEKNHCLVLARDRVGGRPLFYAQLPHCFLFASEYKALLAVNEVPARPNRDAIQYVQCTKTAPVQACCLENVYQVRPGYWLKVTDRRLESNKYWDIVLPVTNASEILHVSAFRKVFDRAVQKQIAEYDDIGVALSGLDSAVTLAGVRHAAPSRVVHSFTAGFGPNDKDLALCAELANHFKTIHHEIVLRSDELEEILPSLVWFMGDPVGREDKPYLFVTNREAAKHVKLLLTGYYSDYLFGGMPRHKLVKAAALPLLARPIEEFYRFTQTGQMPDSLLGRSLVKLYFRGKSYPPPSVIGSSGFPILDLLRGGDRDPLNEHLRSQIFAMSGFSSQESLYTAFGLAYNSPFMDPPVIKTAFEIPDCLKMPIFDSKYILRRSFSDLLPQSIVRRKKTLLRLKHDEHFTRALDSLAERFLSPAALSSRGLFQRDYVEQLRRRRHRPYPSERAYRLWSMILTEIWCRIYLDGRGASDRIAA
jgi:asparagine synthase (glutamine-hydrolysing)